MSIVERTLARMRAKSGTAPPQPTSLRATAAVARLQQEPAKPQRMSPSAEDDATTGPMPVLRRRVLIDRDAMRQEGLLPPREQERRIAEEYRRIKRPLLKAAAAAPERRVLMVGSAFPGEGKSFTCVNLALSLALERDWQVLLVDADVIKPQVSKLFGVEGEAGLLDLLLQPDLHPEHLIVETDLPGLSVLPAGKRDEHATELIGSARMQDVIHRLAQGASNRLIVFDSPPMLQTSEANVLAGYMGQIVLVVAAETTPQAAVLEVTRLVGDGEKLKIVLNKAIRGGTDGYYNGYGYGYYEAVARQESGR